MKKFHILMMSLAFILGSCQADEKEKPEEQKIKEVLTMLRTHNTNTSSQSITQPSTKNLQDENRSLTVKNKMLLWASICALSSIGLKMLDLNASNLVYAVSNTLTIFAGGIFSIFLLDYANNPIKGV